MNQMLEEITDPIVHQAALEELALQWAKVSKTWNNAVKRVPLYAEMLFFQKLEGLLNNKVACKLAIKHNLTYLAKYYIDKSDYNDNYLIHILFAAIKRGRYDLIEYIFVKNLNIIHISWSFSIEEAIIHGHIDMAKRLLDDPRIKNNLKSSVDYYRVAYETRIVSILEMCLTEHHFELYKIREILLHEIRDCTHSNIPKLDYLFNVEPNILEDFSRQKEMFDLICMPRCVVNEELLCWFLDHYNNRYFTEKSLIKACSMGNLPAIKWVFDRYEDLPLFKNYYKLWKHSVHHPHILQWLLQEVHRRGISDDILKNIWTVIRREESEYGLQPLQYLFF